MIQNILTNIMAKDSIITVVGTVITAVGGIAVLYDALRPGLNVVTKRDHSVSKFLLYLIFQWFISLLGTVASILKFSPDITDSIKKVYTIFIIICCIIIFCCIIWFLATFGKRNNIYVCLLYALAPSASGIGMALLEPYLNNQIWATLFGMVLIVTEITGMIYYDKILVIYKHDHATFKLANGDSYFCKCRDLKFHGFRKIVVINNANKSTIVVPFSQIVSIFYEGDVDEVINTESIRYAIQQLLKKIKNRKAI